MIYSLLVLLVITMYSVEWSLKSLADLQRFDLFTFNYSTIGCNSIVEDCEKGHQRAVRYLVDRLYLIQYTPALGIC